MCPLTADGKIPLWVERKSSLETYLVLSSLTSTETKTLQLCSTNNKCEIMMTAKRQVFLALLLTLDLVFGFSPVTPKARHAGLSMTATTTDFQVEVVEGGEDDPRVLDVASFRNGLKNPEIMVERAQAKRNEIDTTGDALKGLKIGLLYVGPAVAGLTYMQTNDVNAALSNYGLFGGGIGATLAGNNYMGRGIHVPDIPEATNRIIVDFSEGLLRQQDVGFVAVSTENPEFEPTNGVMAAVDIQLRNSDKAHPGARKVSGLPAHCHIKNMEVHKTMRRQGVAQALLEAIVDYAKTKTDSEALTLEVEAANPAAVNLYKKFGFETQENPNKLSKNLYMIKNI